MKREFLQNFKVGDQPLPKEIVDAILDENSRDIGETKKAFADYDTLKSQLSEAQKTIQGFQSQGQGMESVRKAARDWEDKYNQAVADHQKQIADMAFDHTLEAAITAAHGRSAKAISSLLDISALKESKNQADDIKAALEGLKKDSGYLFDDEQTPPPYSAGTGTNGSGGNLSGSNALRAAFGLPTGDQK